MKNQFVTYEIAKELKKLKFKEPCLAWYDNKKGNFNMLGQGDIDMPTDYIHTTGFVSEITQAPLWQQAYVFLMVKLLEINDVSTMLEFDIDYSMNAINFLRVAKAIKNKK